MSFDYHVDNRERVFQAERSTCKEARRCQRGWRSCSPMSASGLWAPHWKVEVDEAGKPGGALTQRAV